MCISKTNQNASNNSILVGREEVRVVLTNEMGMGKLFHSARCIAVETEEKRNAILKTKRWLQNDLD